MNGRAECEEPRLGRGGVEGAEVGRLGENADVNGVGGQDGEEVLVR